MHSEDTPTVESDAPTSETVSTCDSAPSSETAAQQAADDSLLVQNLTIVAFAILAMSHISPNLFG